MTRNFFLSPLLALALVGFASRPAAAAPVAVVFADDIFPDGVLPDDVLPDDEAAYNAGTKALNESRWADAVTAFDQVINAKAKKVDAALYWKAYALNKLDKPDLVSDTCAQLRAQYKDSTWNQDCRSMTVSSRERQRTAERVQRDVDRSTDRSMDRGLSISSGSTKDPDSDIKILALNSLVHRDPAQAIPLLRGILTGDQPLTVKQHALFVLAQSKSPEADALSRDLIAGKVGPEMQLQTIRSSGIYRGKAFSDVLAEAYRGTTDAKVKSAVISAYFISGDDVHLVDLARQEKDMELKRRIVSQLSLMKGKAASDYMLELLK